MDSNVSRFNKIILGISAVTLILMIVGLFYLVSLQSDFTKLKDDSEKRLTQAEQQFRTEEAKARLLAIWAYLRLGRTPTELKPELEKTREELRQAFADSESQSKDFWAGIDKQMDDLQKQIDGDRQKFFNSIEKTIQNLEQKTGQ